MRRNFKFIARFGALFVAAAIAATLAGVLIRGNSAAATFEPRAGIDVEYRETAFDGSQTLTRVEYQSDRVWTLTILDGGEGTGYYMQSFEDGTVVAGYPDWEEPHVLTEATDATTVPSVYFARRTVPDRVKGIAVERLDEATLADEQRVSITRTLDRIGVPTRDSIVLVTSTEIAVFDVATEMPLWIALAESTDPFFEVLSIEEAVQVK